MLSRLDNDLAFVQTALKLRAQRQEVLAANLANADTPNFKARDVDFAAALKGAVGGGGGGLELARTSPRHLGGAGGSTGLAAELKYRESVQPSLDGNTVDADVERAHFSENALHLQFLLDRARSTFSTARMALEGGN
ncbi:MAG TPA: flagellar basal body rod protein FlgB [Thiobacillaceae bacterium]|nr:flagellar basal body rod protein FlgB [Thiobacillaceae bacterium]